MNQRAVITWLIEVAAIPAVGLELANGSIWCRDDDGAVREGGQDLLPWAGQRPSHAERSNHTAIENRRRVRPTEGQRDTRRWQADVRIGVNLRDRVQADRLANLELPELCDIGHRLTEPSQVAGVRVDPANEVSPGSADLRGQAGVEGRPGCRIDIGRSQSILER